MSTDTFEHDLAARMGAATETVAAAGVTREGVDERLAARRAARRRRQGRVVLAAAALVVVAGIGALALGSDDEQGSPVVADGGTTEAPTTEPSSTCTQPPGVPEPILPEPVVTDPAAGGCPEPAVVSTTQAPTSVPPQTSPVPTDAPPPTTTETPATTPPATTEPPTTTAPALVAGEPCTPGSSRDCIDPDGDGTHEYLIGGADCLDALSDDIDHMCTDLDGDGYAGYPDSGESGPGDDPDLGPSGG